MVWSNLLWSRMIWSNHKCSLVSIYKFGLSVCLSVCLYPINVKKENMFRTNLEDGREAPSKASIFIFIYFLLDLCKDVSMNIYVLIYLYISLYICMHLCIYVSMYLCIYVSMYLCIYLKTKIIQTSIQTSNQVM